jgi:hypothetical protein
MKMPGFVRIVNSISGRTPMTATVSELKSKIRSRSDRERFGDILVVQRAAYLRDGAPSLTKRRSDLKKFKAAMLARRSAIEEAIQHRLRPSLTPRDGDRGNPGRRPGH